MSIGAPVFAPPEPTPRILVVDDDHRVVELLTVALTGRGFEVITAADGEEAIRQTLTHHPDLIVLDVRLPRRSGLEVCEMLRRDPSESGTPIVLVSAAGETEARLQAFAKGADDYLSKPFSPRELIARIQRLLARAKDARETRQRLREMERELSRAQDDARRAHLETRREFRLRELAFGIGRDLHQALDPDDAAERLLAAAEERLGFGRAALLLPDASGARFVAHTVRGDSFERVAAIAMAADGELAALLRSLGRPVSRHELARLPELGPELPALVDGGVLLLAPLVGPHGLEAVLVTDEPAAGVRLEHADSEMLAGLCEIAALALHNARQVRAQIERALALLAESAAEGASAEFALDTRALAEWLASATGLAPRARSLVRHAVALGSWSVSAAGYRALETLGERDATGFVADLRRLCDRIERMPEPASGPEPDPTDERSALIGFVAIRWSAERDAGHDAETALRHAAEAAGALLDPLTAQALRDATRAGLPAGVSAGNAA